MRERLKLEGNKSLYSFIQASLLCTLTHTLIAVLIGVSTNDFANNTWTAAMLGTLPSRFLSCREISF